MNLSCFISADQLSKALEAVDIPLSDFEIRKKSLEIIPAVGTPEVVKCYLASKAIANLRHTFTTAGLRDGMSLEKLQALMGHTSPETTLIYAKLNQQDLQLEHERVYS